MTAHSVNHVADAVQALQRASSVLQIKAVLRSVGERHGFEYFLCSAPPSVIDPYATSPILFESWPEAWKKHYVEQEHFLHDPMLAELQLTSDPFLWSAVESRRPSQGASRRVMLEAAEMGMSEGYVVPLYGIGGQLHAMTMTGKKPRRDAIAQSELHLVSMYAYARAKRLRTRGYEPSIALSRREREALQWAAIGKTDWEIGEVLDIGKDAAHKRIENAKRKFGVATRVQAIVEALRRGLIQY